MRCSDLTAPMRAWFSAATGGGGSPMANDGTAEVVEMHTNQMDILRRLDHLTAAFSDLRMSKVDRAALAQVRGSEGGQEGSTGGQGGSIWGPLWGSCDA